MTLRKLTFAAAFVVVSAMAQPATAQQIVGATSAVINSGGPGDGSISNTHNQAGLTSNYVSGVTDFNTYIGTNPQHSLAFLGNEWFSNQNASSASVTYNMGAILGLDALALWNEDFSGIGTLSLFGSTDGVLFGSLGVFNPTDTPNNTDYGPQVFGFGPTNVQFLRFDMSNCPQQPAGYSACAIGEVAFRTAAVTAAVPEPSTWAMMLLGFGLAGFALRRRTATQALSPQIA